MNRRGLAIAPEIAVGDGALGFWKALDEVWPGTRHQRCWIHKVANVLNKVPKSVQPSMKAGLRETCSAPDRRYLLTPRIDMARQWPSSTLIAGASSPR